MQIATVEHHIDESNVDEFDSNLFVCKISSICKKNR